MLGKLIKKKQKQKRKKDKIIKDKKKLKIRTRVLEKFITAASDIKTEN